MKYYMPDMTVDNAVKDSEKFGLDMARFIESEWFRGDFEAMRNKVRLIKSHLKGTVDTTQFKKKFQKDNDLSTLSINDKYTSELPRFITAIVEGFSYDQYRATVNGVDAYSQKQRTDFKHQKRKDLYGKEGAQMIQDSFGYDMKPAGVELNSEEEINLYMQLEYKMAHEIAMEIGIQGVLEGNDWREIFNNVVEDLACHGRGVVHTTYDPMKAVDFRYVDVETFICSKDLLRSRDKRGVHYMGEVRDFTINEIEKLSTNLSVDEIKRISSYCGKRYTTFSDFTPYELTQTVEGFYFCFKTNRYDTYKKKGNKNGTYKYISKDNTWTPNEYSKSEVYRTSYEVWYEGIYIPSANVLLDYKLMDNMMRDPSNSNKALPPYIIYDLSTESIASKVIDICDDIYYVKLKLRHFVQKLRPKGYAIDVTGLGNMTLSDNTVLTPLQQIRIFNDEGILLYSGDNLIEDNQSSRMPIHDLPDGSGREFAELINVHNMLIGRLHEVTGINAQAVGQAPPSRTSSDVYQGTLGSSQRVTNNIFNGLISIQKRLSEVIISRLISAALFKETKPIVESIFGVYTTDVLREIGNLHKYQFSVKIDVEPTDVDKARLREDLAVSLQSGSITIADKIDIETIDNMDLAMQMIKIRQKENIKKAEQAAMQQQQVAMQQQQMQAQNAAMLEQERARASLERDLALKQADAQLEAFKTQARLREISLKGQFDIKVAEIQSGAKVHLDSMKEDRKDERTKKQASQQSKLKYQSQTEGEPIDFEQDELGMLAINNQYGQDKGLLR